MNLNANRPQRHRATEKYDFRKPFGLIASSILERSCDGMKRIAVNASSLCLCASVANPELSEHVSNAEVFK
jgi:hypothetical protein